MSERERLYRQVLEQIASLPKSLRGRLARGLALSVLEFVDTLPSEPVSDQSKETRE